MKKLALLTLLGGILLTGCTLPVQSHAQEGPTFKTHGGTKLSKEEYENYISDSNNLFLVESYSEVVDQTTYYYELIALKNTKEVVNIETKTTFNYYSNKSDLNISFSYFENQATSCTLSMTSQDNRPISQLITFSSIHYNPIDEFKIQHNSYNCKENNLVSYTINNSFDSGVYRVDIVDTRYDMILVQKDLENKEMIQAELFRNKSVITHEWSFVKINELPTPSFGF